MITSIQVMGSGCPTCKKLFELTKQAAEELNLTIEVEYVSDIQKIIDMGMLSSPVLVINGQAVLAGQIPSVDKLKQIIGENNDPWKNDAFQGCSCAGHC